MKARRIIAALLCIFAVLSVASCAKKKTDTGKTPDERKNQEEKKESENKYNFLVMGHDRAANLTDVMMIVSFDVKEKSLALLQLPRDTYFEADDYSYHKINGLYNYFINQAKKDDAKDAELEGCARTAKYLSENLDIKIHYSAVMDLDGFGSIVDAIGGVYMYVPYSMYYNDPSQNLYINIDKGYCTLDGNTAEQFVRFRSGYVEADLARQDAQKMFMTAFIENVKKNISFSNVDDIAKAILDSVKTDMKLADIVSFGTALLSTDLENINMMSLPGEAVYSNNDGAWYFVMNKAAVVGLMEKYYNVFEKAVDDKSLDKNKVFCNEDDAEMYEIYTTPAEESNLREHNAKDMSEKDIDIALN